MLPMATAFLLARHMSFNKAYPRPWLSSLLVCEMEVEFVNDTMSCHRGICLGGPRVSCAVESGDDSLSDNAVELADVLSERASMLWLKSSIQPIESDVSASSSFLLKK
jgi:hypothetical protein